MSVRLQCAKDQGHGCKKRLGKGMVITKDGAWVSKDRTEFKGGL